MSHIVIAGGHGQIALRLAALLSARGDRVCSLIRNPDHEADVRATGARPVVADLEALDDLSDLVEGVNAVVFAAGARAPAAGPSASARSTWARRSSCSKAPVAPACGATS
jgi:nucleoside-diphosphate-sugar epimerase